MKKRAAALSGCSFIFLLTKQNVYSVILCIEYYDEMISDIMEMGVSEEEAVKRQGSMEQIISDILAESEPEKVKVRDWFGICLIAISGDAKLKTMVFYIIMRVAFLCYAGFQLRQGTYQLFWEEMFSVLFLLLHLKRCLIWQL